MTGDWRQFGRGPRVCSLVFNDQLSCLRVSLSNICATSPSPVSGDVSRCSSRGNPTKQRRFSFQTEHEDDDDSSLDAWPALKVRRATDFLRVSRVEMQHRTTTTRSSRLQPRRRPSESGSKPPTSDVIAIKIPEEGTNLDSTKNVSLSLSTNEATSITELKINDEDDVTTCWADDVTKPASAAGVVSKIEVLDHNYKLFQRTGKSKSTTRTRVSSAPTVRSSTLASRHKVHTRPTSAQIKATVHDDTAAIKKKLSSRSATHLNMIAERAGKSVKQMKKLVDREPPDAIRIDTQIVDYNIETDGLRECKDMQDRLQKQGVSLSLETLKKGLLPPTQYGFERTQVKTLPDGKIFNYTDGLLSHPSTWLPAQSKARKILQQSEKPVIQRAFCW